MRPAADVDEVRVALHLPELRPTEHRRRPRRVRGRDHDVVALPEQLRQLLHRPERRDLRGAVHRLWIDGDDAHPERGGPPRDLAADRAEADDTQRRVGEVAVGAIHVAHESRSRCEVDPRRLPADRRPFAGRRLQDVDVQVAGEAEDVAHHLVGDDVGEQAAHVGQRARVGREFGEQVVLEAGRRRLHPPQPRRDREQPRRDLAEERISVGHVAEGVLFVAGVHHRHRSGDDRDSVEAFGVDGWVNDEFHQLVRVEASPCSAGTTPC